MKPPLTLEERILRRIRKGCGWEYTEKHIRFELDALAREVVELRSKQIKGKTVKFPGGVAVMRDPGSLKGPAVEIYNLACDDVLALIRKRRK